MKHILFLLLMVLTTHFSMAQTGNRPVKTKVPTTRSTEVKPKVQTKVQPTNADLTIAEFLKTHEGLSLSAEQKAELSKMPPHIKLSELVDESDKQSNGGKGRVQPNASARSMYSTSYTLPSWACCIIYPPRACCTYDCPTLQLNKGASCNDNNPNTTNDKVQNNCTCAGTPIPPSVDCPSLNLNKGDSCNDNNPNTTNDKVNNDCICKGDPTTSTVVNRTEMVNGVNIKIYLQEPANSTNRKGIIVVGSGNNEHAPTPGSLTGTLENALCQKLATEGYIAAIVQYVVPAVATNYSNWNDVSVMMATNYNNAFNGIIAKYGGNRNECIAAGVSFTTFLLFTNIAYYNDLADIKGFMGTCGGTGSNQASNFKIPIASISCSNDFEGTYNINGQDLVDAITNPTIKNMSRGLRDQTCSGHCNGNTNTWVNWLTDSVKQWLP